MYSGTLPATRHLLYVQSHRLLLGGDGFLWFPFTANALAVSSSGKRYGISIITESRVVVCQASLRICAKVKEKSYTGCGKSRFTIVSKQNAEFILVLICIYYCTIFHPNNCKPTSARPCESSEKGRRILERRWTNWEEIQSYFVPFALHRLYYYYILSFSSWRSPSVLFLVATIVTKIGYVFHVQMPLIPKPILADADLSPLCLNYFIYQHLGEIKIT